MCLRKLRRNAVDYGLRTALSKAFWRVVSIVYCRTVYCVYARNLEDAEPCVSTPSPFLFRILDFGALPDGIVPQIEEMEEWLEGSLQKRLESGDICLVALDHDRVAGFNLVAMRGAVQIPLINTSRSLGPREAWSEQITVHRNYRRRGLGTELRQRLFYELKKRGVSILYGGTLASNQVSRSFALFLGFTETREIRYSRLLGVSRWKIHQLS
jgi:GNAT superfamily N-acetyltransferase